MASLRAVNAATGQVLSTRRRRTTVPQVVTFIACSKRGSLLMAADDDEMFMTLTPNTAEQHLIARSDKSVDYVLATFHYSSKLQTLLQTWSQTCVNHIPLF